MQLAAPRNRLPDAIARRSFLAMRFNSSLCRFQNAVISSRHSRRSFPLPPCVRRGYATEPSATSSDVIEPPRQNIAILGSGITALSAAYHLLLTPNPPNITIYEKQSRVGGWLHSKYVDLPDGSGSVLFETGPRNVRPVVPIGLATVALWEDLGLSGNMIVTPRSSNAARRRWLYYPDRLVELPGQSRGLFRNLWTLFTEPAFKGYFKDLMYEMSKERRSDAIEDESVGDFISRRVNPKLVNQVASAVLHGIYAGDAWQLSARSVLSDAWWAEKKAGSVFQGMMMMQREGWMKRRHAELLEVLTLGQRPSESVVRMVKDASTVTLDGGIQMFSDALQKSLENFGKVNFRTNTEVKSVSLGQDGNDIEVCIICSMLLCTALTLAPGHDCGFISTAEVRSNHLDLAIENAVVPHTHRSKPRLIILPRTVTERYSECGEPVLQQAKHAAHNRIWLPYTASYALRAQPGARPWRGI